MSNPSQGAGGGTRDHSNLLNLDVSGAHPAQAVGDLTPYSHNASDIGKNWKNIGFLTSGNYVSSSYLGNGIAILGNNTGHIWRSSDYGQTWTDLGAVDTIPPLTPSVRTVCNLGNGTVIFGDSNGNLFRSTDFGLTWDVQFSGGFFGGVIGSSAYLGNDVILLSVGTHVWRSTDFGVSYVDMGVVGSPGINKIIYLENGISIFSTSDGHIWRSIDSGLNWTDLGIIGSTAITTMSYLGNGVVILGNLQHVFRSFDFGLNWVDLGAISTFFISSISYIGNGVTIFTDQASHIFRSSNYGLTWTDLGAIGFALLSEYLGNGIVIAASSVVFRSDVSYKIDEARVTVLDDVLHRKSEVVGVLSPSSINPNDIGVNWQDLGVIDTRGMIGGGAYLENGIAVMCSRDAAGVTNTSIYRSSDYGTTWAIAQTVATTKLIFEIDYLGNGIAVGGDDGGHIWRTTNFGVSWTDLGAISASFIVPITNIGHGVVIFGDGLGVVQRSVNFGLTWPLAIAVSGSSIRALEYLDNDIALAGDGNGHIWRSTNISSGFPSFTDLGQKSTVPSLIEAFANLSNGVVLAGVGNGEIIRSTDLGVTWINLGNITSNEIQAIKYVGNGIVLLNTHGAGAHIWKSTDYGLTWTDLGIVTPRFIDSTFTYLNNGIFVFGDRIALGPGHIWRSEVSFKLDETRATVHNDLLVRNPVGASAHNSELVGTLSPYSMNHNDIGKNWVLTAVYTTSILDMEYLGSGIVLATTGPVAGDSHILRSTDHGRTFNDNITISLGGSTIAPISYLGNGIVIFGTSDGHIWRSTDFGLTFSDVGLISAFSITKIKYLGHGYAIAGDAGNSVQRSVNFGATWPLAIVLANAIQTISYLDNGIAIVGDNNGHIWRSTTIFTGFPSFTDLGDVTGTNTTLLTSSYLGNGVVIVGTGNGHIIRSTNFGLNWTDLGLISASFFSTSAYLGNGVAICGALNGHIWQSTDYGLTWTDIVDITASTILRDTLKYIGNGAIVVGDFAGNIFRSDISYKLDESIQDIEKLIRTITTSETLEKDDDTLLVDATLGNITIFLPSITTAPEHVFHFIRVDGSLNTVLIDAAGAETINLALTQPLNLQFMALSMKAKPFAPNAGWWIF